MISGYPAGQIGTSAGLVMPSGMWPAGANDQALPGQPGSADSGSKSCTTPRASNSAWLR